MSIIAILTFLPSLLANMFMVLISSRRWYDRIDNTVILGALPFARLTAKLMNDENVKAVVSMNEDYELWWANGRREWELAGVEFLQLPVTDVFETPDLTTLQEGVDFINRFTSKSDVKQLQPNSTVYVHCKAGRTRSATLVGCYLMQRYGWRPEKAVQYMKEKRSQIWLFRNQWKSLEVFYKHLISSYNKINVLAPL